MSDREESRNYYVHFSCGNATLNGDVLARRPGLTVTPRGLLGWVLGAFRPSYEM